MKMQKASLKEDGKPAAIPQKDRYCLSQLVIGGTLCPLPLLNASLLPVLLWASHVHAVTVSVISYCVWKNMFPCPYPPGSCNLSIGIFYIDSLDLEWRNMSKNSHLGLSSLLFSVHSFRYQFLYNLSWTSGSLPDTGLVLISSLQITFCHGETFYYYVFTWEKW